MIDYGKYNDEELLALLRKDSPLADRAFDIIYNRYATKLNAFCVFKSGNILDAEELFEDTWLKFIARIKDGKQLDNILPYLYSIARTIAIDKYRQKNTNKTIKIDYKDIMEIEEIANPYNFLSQIEKEELISLVKIAVSNLDDLYKEAFVLQWFGGLSIKEISDILQISEGAAKMRCHRATGEIVKMLKPYFVEN